MNDQPLAVRIVLIGLFSSLLLIIACHPESTEDGAYQNVIERFVTLLPDLPEDAIPITPRLNQLTLQDQAGLDGRLISTLTPSDTLYYLNEFSDFATILKLDGTSYEAPWLRVVLKDGRTGWVYAEGVQYLIHPAEQQNLLFKHRLHAFFGSALAQQVESYNEGFASIQTAQEFTQLSRTADTLRQRLRMAIDRKLETEPRTILHDLNWIGTAIKGFVILPSSERPLDFWRDYKVWAGYSRTTPEAIDDAFIDLCFQIYSTDSIESDLHTWSLPISPVERSSLLGRGLHWWILQSMSTIVETSPLFTPEINELKRNLITDIVEGPAYWESLPAILAELDSIRLDELATLTPADKIALETRRRIFLNYAANGIQINQRLGN